MALHGDVPCALHGGPLLGVALKRMTSSGAELSGEDASPVMQFYSWNGVSKVGGGFGKRGRGTGNSCLLQILAGTVGWRVIVIACECCIFR